jgi:hypothetical protein
MGTDTIVSNKYPWILMRFLESDKMKLENSIFVVLSMMARARLKFFGKSFLGSEMYCVKIKAGEDHPAVSCVIYFSVWFLNVYREEEGKCNEKCMENAW